ncbi:MAG: Gfo/Idh/MocA family oxidoreductase [Verrucomicrobiales bacterium]|nr:Gfo/Idh/MocA family oxidoreductase [Verrucomicrobiales bacterium]
MKIAAIGAGAWGRNIVRTLHQLGVLGVVAESMEPLRAQVAADYPSVAVLANYSDLFSRADIAAVTIATPAATHHRIAKDCLLAGKDVFVEKPMTLTVAESEDLVETAGKTGRILMVGHMLLYKPAVRFIRDYLASGALGKVFTLHQERMKLGKARSVENALWSLGVHDVAALLYIANEAPVEVKFSGHCGLQSAIEDDTYLHLTFADGRKAHLHNSWLWPEDRRGLKIIGQRGMLLYDEKAETVTLIKKRVDARLYNVDEGSELLFESPKDFQALTAEMQHFLDCIKSRQQPRSCGRNGLEVIRVLEQAAN